MVPRRGEEVFGAGNAGASNRDLPGEREIPGETDVTDGPEEAIGQRQHLLPVRSGNPGNAARADVFVRDVDRNITRLVSATAAGEPGNNTSDADGAVDPTNAYLGQLTPNGRFVVFYTQAQALDPKETSTADLNVYVRDLHRHTTTLVNSIHPGGACE